MAATSAMAGTSQFQPEKVRVDGMVIPTPGQLRFPSIEHGSEPRCRGAACPRPGRKFGSLLLTADAGAREARPYHQSLPAVDTTSPQLPTREICWDRGPSFRVRLVLAQLLVVAPHRFGESAGHGVAIDRRQRVTDIAPRQFFRHARAHL